MSFLQGYWEGFLDIGFIGVACFSGLIAFLLLRVGFCYFRKEALSKIALFSGWCLWVVMFLCVTLSRFPVSLNSTDNVQLISYAIIVLAAGNILLLSTELGVFLSAFGSFLVAAKKGMPHSMLCMWGVFICLSLISLEFLRHIFRVAVFTLLAVD